MHGLPVAQHHLAMLPDLDEVVPTLDGPCIPRSFELQGGGPARQPVLVYQPVNRVTLGDPTLSSLLRRFGLHALRPAASGVTLPPPMPNRGAAALIAEAT
jgi:hypothetical protein